VWRALLCDGVSPVEVYARLAAAARERGAGAGGIRYMLESVGAGGERWARYSVVGLGCRARITGVWNGAAIELAIEAAPGFVLPSGVPARSRGLAAIEALLAAYHSPATPEQPRFWGGLVGVWGHDSVRAFEHLPTPASASPGEPPAIELIVSDTVLVFDNFSQRVQIFAGACPESDGGYEAAVAAAHARIDEVAAWLDTAAVLRPQRLPEVAAPIAEPSAPWTREGFLAAVQRARAYISAGDIFQVVLSQRFVAPRAGARVLDIYRMLRVTNPAPYMYLFELPSATLIGASPEVLVRLDRAGLDRSVSGARSESSAATAGLRVTVRPIAGTRPRGRDAAEDEALARELLADPKERAEHLMLVDLGRNDLGRVCVGGSVRVTESFALERYSRVMHIVSEVQGELRPELTALDALRATFPAGTLSGAPKIRALQIIDELEPAPRGWYGGAVGYLGFDGAADFAICIRSLVVTGQEIRVQAGAGLVHDSLPEVEDRECQAKASAVLRALAMARAQGDESQT
jgi:anthranilate synthase component 1